MRVELRLLFATNVGINIIRKESEGGGVNRGYFGIGIYSPKTVKNVGTLWRSALNFGASYIFTIGHRYKEQPCDTTKTHRHIPLFTFDSLKEFEKSVDQQCEIVCIEQTENSFELSHFILPLSCVYLLGAEDCGIPKELTNHHRTLHRL